MQSRLDLTQHLNFDTAYYYYDAIPHTLPPGNRVDVGLSSKPIHGFTFSVWGRNLQTDRHQEAAAFVLPPEKFAGRSSSNLRGNRIRTRERVRTNRHCRCPLGGLDLLHIPDQELPTREWVKQVRRGSIWNAQLRRDQSLASANLATH